MDLVVDGYIFELQAQGGISRLYKEILPRMCDMDPELRIELLLQKKVSQSLPAHSHINPVIISKINRYFRPRRFWSRFEYGVREETQGLFFRGHQNAIWHSTYFTNPKHWQGPVVLTIHDLIYERLPDLFNARSDDLVRRQKQKCVDRAVAIIADSFATKNDILDYYRIPGGKVTVIHCAYSPSFVQLNSCEFPSELLSKTKKPFLLYVGRRSHNKNFVTLAKAYRLWRKKEEIDLVVVGEEWTDQEKQYILDFGLSDSIHLLQNIPDEKLCALYNLAFGFIYPSLYEGFGIPLLEAMACACPVIASNIPTNLEIGGVCPIYFETLDPESLCNALDFLYAEGRNLKRIKDGIERAQGFSFEKTAYETLQLYHSLT